jgi:cobalt-zinc-cadmium efflux system membrane fusion protein
VNGNGVVRTRGTPIKSGAVLVLSLVVLMGFVAHLLGMPLPWTPAAGGEQTVQARPLGVELVPGSPHTLSVPEDVRVALGIRKGNVDKSAVAVAPTESRALVLSGSTALDPARVMRIRARFAPAEVIEVGRPEVPGGAGSGQTGRRELRPGDNVEKDQLLGVFYSLDVGSKKNDLIDALLQLKLDQQILDRARAAAQSLPEVQVLSYLRNVEADQNAINRAVNTLKVWNIPDKDVEAVYKEAEEIGKRGGKRDPEKQKQWGRVEVRAPDAGTIVERNVTEHEIVVDQTVNLFQIAKVDRLVVLANAPEDDLPELLKWLRGGQRRGTLRTVGTTAPKGDEWTIDEIGYLIDPNQHSAVVKGHIKNPEDRLRAGQFVSATVELPPPEDVVEVPVSAVVDDGRQCVVFVQPDPAKPHYVLRRVEVTHRFDKKVFVRSRFDEKEEARLKQEKKDLDLLPVQPLHENERVLTAGVLELKKELEDRESQGAE